MLAKMRFVVIEKWEGSCWDDCLANQSLPIPTPCNPSCHEEEHQLKTLRRVKTLNSSVVTVFYLNAILDFNYLNLHAQYTKADANLRNTDGTLCHLTNDNGMVNVTVYDFSQESARRLWVDAVRNLTATGVVDGIYADQMHLFAKYQSQLKGMGLCKNYANTCCTMTADKAAAFNAGKNKAMQEVKDLLGPNALLGAGRNTSIITSLVIHGNEFEHSPQKLASAIRTALAERPYVHVVANLPTGDQRTDHNPNNTQSICR
jgi:hypothetical protein